MCGTDSNQVVAETFPTESKKRPLSGHSYPEYNDGEAQKKPRSEQGPINGDYRNQIYHGRGVESLTSRLAGEPEIISLLDDDDDPPERYEETLNYNRGTQSNPYDLDSYPLAECFTRSASSSTAVQGQFGQYPLALEPVAPDVQRRQDDAVLTETKANDPAGDAAEPVLSDEQLRLVQLIESGRNVFYTGSAGTGKSTVLKAFVKSLREKGRRVHIIAPTGRAALGVNGTTVGQVGVQVPGAV